jgi:hypothetical protein
MTGTEYRTKFGKNLVLRLTPTTQTEERPEKVKYTSNSVWQTIYWVERYGYTEEEAKLKVSEYQSKNGIKANINIDLSTKHFTVDYWIAKGMSLEEANEHQRCEQSKRSAKSSKFLNKNHTKESKRKISETMKSKILEIGTENWCDHFGQINSISKIELHCFNFIKEHICNNLESNKFIDYYYVDMIVGNKIIEFFGDYWHCNPYKYSKDYINTNIGKSANEIWQSDMIRINSLKSKGYDVLIIWESEWIKDQSKILNKVRKFLYDS